MTTTAANVKHLLRELADPEKAAFYPRFFKTGPGEYGEGDRFLGVVVPQQRQVARRNRDLSLAQVEKLLYDPYHECRLTALLILVEKHHRGDETTKAEMCEFYLKHLDQVNNWDLVDSSAHKILGPSLEDGDRGVLTELAESGSLWRQRVAMIACLHFIKQGDFSDTKRIARLLLDHEHDLIHKAVGWMLREMGERDIDELKRFLAKRYQKMPRTMLRYAIEKLPQEERQAYLRGEV